MRAHACAHKRFRPCAQGIIENARAGIAARKHRICGQSTANCAVIAADFLPARFCGVHLRRRAVEPAARQCRTSAVRQSRRIRRQRQTGVVALQIAIFLLQTGIQFFSRNSFAHGRLNRRRGQDAAPVHRAGGQSAGKFEHGRNARDAVDLFQQFEQIRRERADVLVRRNVVPLLRRPLEPAQQHCQIFLLRFRFIQRPHRAQDIHRVLNRQRKRAILPLSGGGFPNRRDGGRLHGIRLHKARQTERAFQQQRLTAIFHLRIQARQSRQVHAHLTGAQGLTGQHRQRRFIKNRLEWHSSFLQILSSLLFTIKHYTAFSRKLQSLNCKKTRISRVFIMLMRIFSTIRFPPHPSRKSRCFLPYSVRRTP